MDTNNKDIDLVINSDMWYTSGIQFPLSLKVD